MEKCTLSCRDAAVSRLSLRTTGRRREKASPLVAATLRLAPRTGSGWRDGLTLVVDRQRGWPGTRRCDRVAVVCLGCLDQACQIADPTRYRLGGLARHTVQRIRLPGAGIHAVVATASAAAGGERKHRACKHQP